MISLEYLFEFFDNAVEINGGIVGGDITDNNDETDGKEEEYEEDLQPIGKTQSLSAMGANVVQNENKKQGKRGRVFSFFKKAQSSDASSEALIGGSFTGGGGALGSNSPSAKDWGNLADD